MLEQMECFDWRDATCTLETDRIVIKKHIFTLFDEALEPPLSVTQHDSLDISCMEYYGIHELKCC